MKTAKQLREEVGELLNKCESLNELAASEEREFTAEETKQFDAWMAEIGNDGRDGGEKSGLYAAIDRAEKFERLVDSKSKPEAKEQKTKIIAAEPRRYAGKLRAFKSEQDAYDAAVWFKAAILKDENARASAIDKGIWNAQTEGTNADGGYTVPDLLSNAIINVMDNAGVARQLCRIVPMASDSLDIPKRSSGQTVYYPGEASAITASDKGYGIVQLTAVKRAVLTQISNELLADSVINVMDDVAMEAGNQLALQQDLEFIQGDGTGTYGSETGLISSCGAAGTHDLASTETSWADATLDDFNTCMSLVADKFWNDGQMAWIMRRQVYSEVVTKLLYAAGGNTVTSIAGGVRPELFGYPIYFTDKMPADAVSTYIAFFGNFREAAVIGDRQSVQVASSMDYGFNLDVMTLRLTSRYDINVHESPGSGTSYGAYAGIKTAAS